MIGVVLGGIALLLAGEVVIIHLIHNWLQWVKQTEIPWFNALSKFINPEKK